MRLLGFRTDPERWAIEQRNEHNGVTKPNSSERDSWQPNQSQRHNRQPWQHDAAGHGSRGDPESKYDSWYQSGRDAKQESEHRS